MALKALKIIGLMSGTSLDGIDVAMLETDGEKIHAFGPTYFRTYSDKERKIIEGATQAALKWNFEGAPPNSLSQAEEIIDQAHIEAVQGFLKHNDMLPAQIDLIGYHGQTILHRPPKNAINGKTLQLGVGQKLANALHIGTVFDFRSNDMEHGGQGAPLAPVYHKALVEKSQLTGTTGILNVGGVSNITIISRDGDTIATDCGPGNGPLDSWVAQNNAGSYDKDGRAALAGRPDFTLVYQWLEREFFQKPAPKSADRWDFDVLDDLRGYSIADGAATLIAFTALSIVSTLRLMGQPIDNVIICGGGRRNPALMAALTEELTGQIKSAESVGWKGDDIEAQAFAYLAARNLNRLPLSYPATTGVKTPVSGGILAKPIKRD